MPSNIKDPKDAPLTLVNAIEVSGHANGIVNILFSRAVFIPNIEKVTAEKVYPLDLRFDLFCAQQLRDALDQILKEQVTPKKMDS